MHKTTCLIQTAHRVCVRGLKFENDCLQGERIDDLKMILGRVADAATLFDANGINVRFMNSPVEGNNVRSSAEATSLLGQVRNFDHPRHSPRVSLI